MHEVRLWWRMPGETQVRTLRANPEGVDVFHFAPFLTNGACPYIQVRGTVEPAEFPEPGTMTLRTAAGEGTSRESHLRAISLAIEAIEEGALEKVVLARVEVQPTNDSPEAAFKAKCLAHPSSFCYLLAHPQAGVWVGATPELLLVQSGIQCRTVSLAGTRIAGRSTTWTEKERHEQQIVTAYIEGVLAAAGASDIEMGGLVDRAYGDMVHLERSIAFQYEGPFALLARALHPTPAVGGQPLAAALRLIPKWETEDRRYYAGYIGWERPGHAEVFVNLRCVQWCEKAVRMYAGGGITAGSTPLSEWNETVEKMTAIRASLG